MARTRGFSPVLALRKTELGGSSWTEMYPRHGLQSIHDLVPFKTLNNYYENIGIG